MENAGAAAAAAAAQGYTGTDTPLLEAQERGKEMFEIAMNNLSIARAKQSNMNQQLQPVDCELNEFEKQLNDQHMSLAKTQVNDATTKALQAFKHAAETCPNQMLDMYLQMKEGGGETH